MKYRIRAVRLVDAVKIHHALCFARWINKNEWDSYNGIWSRVIRTNRGKLKYEKKSTKQLYELFRKAG